LNVGGKKILAFGPKKDEVTGVCIKVNNEGLEAICYEMIRSGRRRYQEQSKERRRNPSGKIMGKRRRS
jgi:hypothetical protein